MDASEFICNCERTKHLKMLIDHFECKRLVEFLVVSPDMYECSELYEYIYDNIAVGLDMQSLTNMTDGIDQLYRNIYERVIRHVPTKYSQESFTFHKWISQTAFIVGSVEPR